MGQCSFELKIFSDDQVAAKVMDSGDLDVQLRGNSYADLFRAATVKEAWDAKHKLDKSVTARLTLFCLIGQRSDRRFHEGESFDLKVITDFINQMKFDRVRVLHPHSEITLALIDRSERLEHLPYVKKAFLKEGSPVLISPDAGAYKTTHHIAEELGASLVPSNKVRVNGAPVLSVQGDVKGKKCLIVDDLADGGRTFMFLAEELKKQGAVRVTLYVTHGQFHHGFDELRSVIDHIYCTNSYREIKDEFVTQFKVL